jgi:hypothetical protein
LGWQVKWERHKESRGQIEDYGEWEPFAISEIEGIGTIVYVRRQIEDQPQDNNEGAR